MATSKPNERQIWFPAKRYGWGWGPPVRWQGWIVLIVWVAILLGASPWLAPRSLVAFFIFITCMTAALIAICYLKGETPRWRWGTEGQEESRAPRDV